MAAFITCEACGATLECSYSQDESNETASLFIMTDWDGNVVDVYVECNYCGAVENLDEAPRRERKGPEGDVHINEALSRVSADYLSNATEFVGDKVFLKPAEEGVFGVTPPGRRWFTWERFVEFMTKRRGSGRG